VVEHSEPRDTDALSGPSSLPFSARGTAIENSADTPTARRLDAQLTGPGSRAVIEAEDFAALCEEAQLEPGPGVFACLAWAKRWAQAPISKFDVGAVVLGGSGRVYLGANIEFTGVPLHNTIHAEQAAITMAWAHSERSLQAIATTAAPCGHCRQFMLELPEPRPRLYTGTGDSQPLLDLLPAAFGPRSLEREPQLLIAGPHPIDFLDPEDAREPTARLALGVARRSSAPYSGAHAGVAIVTQSGHFAAGGVLESAAFNPTLGPMHSAAIVLHHSGGMLDQIVDAILVERDGASVSQVGSTELLLECLGARGTLRRLFIG